MPRKIRVKPRHISRNVKIIPKNSNHPRNSNSNVNIKNAHSFFGKESSHLLKDIIFVAYYTINTPYQQESEKLKESLEKFNLIYDIVGVNDLGTWQANTRYKAKFLQEMLIKHKEKNLVYVDVDAIFNSVPILFKDYSYDIGIRYQDFRWKQNECLSGTIFLSNNPKVMRLCKEWEKINVREENNKSNLEQWNLGAAIDLLKPSLQLSVINIPPEYTFIFDSMKKLYPKVKPVIEHFQASRQNRHRR